MWIQFAKLDIFLKTKRTEAPYANWKIKIMNSCEMYLTVHDGNHELEFCDRVPNEKNQD